MFAENWRGLYLIRGENVVLLGEVVRPPAHLSIAHSNSFCAANQDLDQEDDVPLRRVTWAALEEYHKEEADAKKHRDEAKAQILFEQKGFCKEGGEGDGY